VGAFPFLLQLLDHCGQVCHWAPRSWMIVFVILKGYIDESYWPPGRPQLFTLACTMSDIKGWQEINAAWKRCLNAKNRQLRGQGRKTLSRYHASDCANLKNEFEGWDVPEQIEFTKTLLAIFKRHWVNVIAYTMPMESFYAEFPECINDPFPACYSILKLLMLEIVDQIERARNKFGDVKETKIAFFYERNPCGGTLTSTFDSAKNDPTFAERELFKTIEPVGWEDCIAIQPADLMAYDVMKDAKQQMAGKPQRKTIEFLLSTGTFSGRARSFKPNAFKILRQLIDEGKAKGFDAA
jgi:hypothetical protein